MTRKSYNRKTCGLGTHRAKQERFRYSIASETTRVSITLLAWLLTSGEAWAQSSPDPTPVPPAVTLVDRNEVNLATGRLELQKEQAALEAGSVSSFTVTSGSAAVSSMWGMLSTQAVPGVSGSLVNGFLEMHVQWGLKYHNFLVGSTQSPNRQGSLYQDAVMQGPYFEKGAGNATLSCTGGSGMTQLYGNGGTCTVTEGDGTLINFLMGYSEMNELNHQYPLGDITSVVKPDGEILTLATSDPRGPINSSLGFRFVFPGSGAMFPNSPGTYTVPIESDIINTSIDYCGSSPSACPISANATRRIDTIIATIGSNYQGSVTSWQETMNGIPLKTILPTSSGGIANCGGGSCYDVLSSVALGGYPFKIVSPLGVTRVYSASGCSFNCTNTWTATKQNTTTYQFYYNLSGQAPPTTATVVNPDGSTATYSFVNGILMSKTDELGRTQTYQYFAGNNWGVTPGLPRISRIYAPNSPGSTSGYTQYDYTHGALSTITVVPTDGSPNLVTQLGITLTCGASNYKICNKPQYMIDPNGNRTDYTYDPAHGGMLTATMPADPSGVRPQKRYSYTQLYPKILSSPGVLVNSTPVWRLTKVSECTSATPSNPASCVGTSTEKVTTYAYNSNNLFLTSVTTAAGDGSNSGTIFYTYNYIGDVTSVKGPRTDVDDTRYTTYDGLRRKVFEIGADPDGAGPLPRLITHHVYDADGNEIRTEAGTGNATDGSDFVVSQFKRMTYDPVSGLLVKIEEVAP